MSAPGQFTINTASSGDVTIAPAPTGPGAFISVLSWHVSAKGATDVTLKSGSNVIDGASLGTNTFVNYHANPGGLGVVDCNPGDPLVLNNSNGVQIYGVIRFAVVGAG